MFNLDLDAWVLTEALRDFARAVAEHQEPAAILQQLCEHCITLLGVDGAGVLLEDGDGDLRYVTSTNDLALGLEQLQIDLQQGPCMTCYAEMSQVHIADVATAGDRWPRFAPAAAELGIGSIYAFPLSHRMRAIGTLNLLRVAPADLDTTAAGAAQLLADVASSYVVNSLAFAKTSELAQHLQRALDSRVVIEQAKGKLAGQLGIGVEEAFALFRGHARNTGRNLRDVARDVLEDRYKPSLPVESPGHPVDIDAPGAGVASSAPARAVSRFRAARRFPRQTR
jgi:transcriptional regulator with GAF, ATPase, and Fis domain